MVATKENTTIKKNEISVNMNARNGGNGSRMFYLKGKDSFLKVRHTKRQTEICQHKKRFKKTHTIKKIGARRWDFHRHWI